MASVANQVASSVRRKVNDKHAAIINCFKFAQLEATSGRLRVAKHRVFERVSLMLATPIEAVKKIIGRWQSGLLGSRDEEVIMVLYKL